MQIIIGRDAKTSQLDVIIGQQTLRLGAPGSVPQTVSRQHCRITVAEDGTYLVENLKAANITYINNVGVEKKTMRREDSLALGTDRYQVDTRPATRGHRRRPTSARCRRCGKTTRSISSTKRSKAHGL